MGITNKESIAATIERYKNYIHNSLLAKIVTTCLVLILTLKNFVFNSKLYLQKIDFPMGTLCVVLWHIQIFFWLDLNKNAFVFWQNISSFLAIY